MNPCTLAAYFDAAAAVIALRADPAVPAEHTRDFDEHVSRLEALLTRDDLPPALDRQGVRGVLNVARNGEGESLLTVSNSLRYEAELVRRPVRYQISMDPDDVREAVPSILDPAEQLRARYAPDELYGTALREVSGEDANDDEDGFWAAYYDLAERAARHAVEAMPYPQAVAAALTNATTELRATNPQRARAATHHLTAVLDAEDDVEVPALDVTQRESIEAISDTLASDDYVPGATLESLATRIEQIAQSITHPVSA